MDIEVAAKLIALLGAIIGLPKIWREVSDFRRVRLHDQLALSKELVASLKGDSHPLITESAYQALTGDNSLSASEIRSLINLEKPHKALRLFKQGRSYLVHEPSNLDAPFNFKEEYAEPRYRNRTSLRYAVLYFLSSCAAALPLLFAENLFGKITVSVLVGLCAWLLIVGRVAKFSLDRHMSVMAAEDLVKRQGNKG